MIILILSQIDKSTFTETYKSIIISGKVIDVILDSLHKDKTLKCQITLLLV